MYSLLTLFIYSIFFVLHSISLPLSHCFRDFLHHIHYFLSIVSTLFTICYFCFTNNFLPLLFHSFLVLPSVTTLYFLLFSLYFFSLPSQSTSHSNFTTHSHPNFSPQHIATSSLRSYFISLHFPSLLSHTFYHHNSLCFPHSFLLFFLSVLKYLY